MEQDGDWAVDWRVVSAEAGVVQTGSLRGLETRSDANRFSRTVPAVKVPHVNPGVYRLAVLVLGHDELVRVQNDAGQLGKSRRIDGGREDELGMILQAGGEKFCAWSGQHEGDFARGARSFRVGVRGRIVRVVPDGRIFLAGDVDDSQLAGEFEPAVVADSSARAAEGDGCVAEDASDDPGTKSSVGSEERGAFAARNERELEGGIGGSVRAECYGAAPC
jgi:hypothetical protein